MSINRLRHCLIKLLAISICFIFIYRYMPMSSHTSQSEILTSSATRHNVSHNYSAYISWQRQENISRSSPSIPFVHLWCTIVKIQDSNSAIAKKFELFVNSLAQHSNRSITLNILADKKSKSIAKRIVSAIIDPDTGENVFHQVFFYDIDDASRKIKPIIRVMQKYFSSVPGTYYSDSLFYISVGLHKIAPKDHDQVILLDIDLKFETSIFSLYEKFNEFGKETLFGLTPELTPVYHHILWKWKQTNTMSPFGEPSYRGYSGLNSGVMLLSLNAIRKSKEYRDCIQEPYIDYITSKYFFKGHLGDQDFYTLLGMEKPHLIMILPCTWNRQLCQWWKHHGYAEVFDDFARCSGPINIYHGNCNTPMPK